MNGPTREDPFALHKSRVSASFDAASSRYDAAAQLQETVRNELLERLLELRFEPRTILDLGAGTGVATQTLKRHFPKALIVAADFAPAMLRVAAKRSSWLRPFHRVVADAQQLPFQNARFDLVFSSLMFQWCDNLAKPLAEVRRVLRPTGCFVMSTFGPDTLSELRHAWAQAGDNANHVSRFLDVHDVGDALLRAGLTEPVLDVDRLVLQYDRALDLMHELKTIGARNATQGRQRGLTSKGQLAAVIAAYETLRRDGKLPATYEVVYATAWGNEGVAAATVGGRDAASGEVRIDVDSIGRSARARPPE
ncbi:MAG: malonyl-ACP O-methyltransferase BioC [Proteobacteria bacterium]|jgi:malonyl-CoA O-methyltransferase|nr:malonyl-ACP O-methyltransferase BioC [Pseudomonadota bacterium]